MTAWTKTRPQATGYYWLRRDPGRPRVVWVHACPKQTVVIIPGRTEALPLDSRTLSAARWSGPLRPPASWSTQRPRCKGFHWLRNDARGEPLVVEVRHEVLLDEYGVGVAPVVVGLGLHRIPLDDEEFDPCLWAGPLSAGARHNNNATP